MATDAPARGLRAAVPDMNVIDPLPFILGAAYFAAYKAPQKRVSIADRCEIFPWWCGNLRGRGTALSWVGANFAIPVCVQPAKSDVAHALLNRAEVRDSERTFVEVGACASRSS